MLVKNVIEHSKMDQLPKRLLKTSESNFFFFIMNEKRN